MPPETSAPEMDDENDTQMEELIPRNYQVKYRLASYSDLSITYFYMCVILSMTDASKIGML